MIATTSQGARSARDSSRSAAVSSAWREPLPPCPAAWLRSFMGRRSLIRCAEPPQRGENRRIEPSMDVSAVTARRAIGAASLILVLLPEPAAFADVYSSKDANGIVHFSSTPTAGSALFLKQEPRPPAAGESALRETWNPVPPPVGVDRAA